MPPERGGRLRSGVLLEEHSARPHVRTCAVGSTNLKSTRGGRPVLIDEDQAGKSLPRFLAEAESRLGHLKNPVRRGASFSQAGALNAHAPD
jgi:hypothetical protein